MTRPRYLVATASLRSAGGFNGRRVFYVPRLTQVTRMEMALAEKLQCCRHYSCWIKGLGL